MKAIVAEYDPNFASMGLDEVNLDVTEYLQRNGLDNDEGRQELAFTVRMRVNKATKLTCSAGIGPNRMIAKICSDINKPNGQSYVKPDRADVLKFISNLALRKIPGVGGMRETTLNAMGIKSCQDLRDRACDIMIGFLEHEHTFLIRCGLGLG